MIQDHVRAYWTRMTSDSQHDCTHIIHNDTQALWCTCTNPRCDYVVSGSYAGWSVVAVAQLRRPTVPTTHSAWSEA